MWWKYSILGCPCPPLPKVALSCEMGVAWNWPWQEQVIDWVLTRLDNGEPVGKKMSQPIGVFIPTEVSWKGVCAGEATLYSTRRQTDSSQLGNSCGQVSWPLGSRVVHGGHPEGTILFLYLCHQVPDFVLGFKTTLNPWLESGGKKSQQKNKWTSLPSPPLLSPPTPGRAHAHIPPHISCC